MIVRTPPMGWNSWNTFGHDINEKLIMETADVMAENGFLEAGYNYLVIDDCWSEMQRDENGRLVPDRSKFPNGMKAVADYVHSKGLKFGIYSCCGNLTCARYPGSYDYEFIDAATFAEWGVDYLKYDNCHKPTEQKGHLLYKRMGLALANCGRDIVFSACNWGTEEVQNWIKSTGAHLWRSTGDIFDTWGSIKQLAMEQLKYTTTNGLGCFNDMDMLVVGMKGKGNVGLAGCTDIEYRTHFSVWAMLGSPLMIGCDIRNTDQITKETLLNKEVIAINQDPAYRQPFDCGNYCYEGNSQTIARFLENGDIAIAVFNFTDDTINSTISLDTFGLDKGTGKALAIRDLWEHKDLGVYRNIFCTPNVPAHGCLMMRAKVVDAE